MKGLLWEIAIISRSEMLEGKRVSNLGNGIVRNLGEL